MRNEDSAAGEWSIDRRTALKGAGMASAGLLGGSALTGSAVARPGQSCACPEGEFLAKYDFECTETECVEWDEDGEECLEEECVDWGFVLAEGDDVVDITYRFDESEYNKGDEDDFEEAEPNYVEFEADGYVIQGVCAYGGRDTDDAADEEGLTSFASDLTNPGGQEAAISNITFCGRAESD